MKSNSLAHKRLKLQNNSGQAIVEYVFLLTAVLAILTAISFGFRRIQYLVWMPIVCEVVAACPNCPTDPEVRARANQLSPGACRR